MAENNIGRTLHVVLNDISTIICKDYRDRHGWQLTEPADIDVKLDLTKASFYRIDDTIYLIHGATPYVYIGDCENEKPAGVYLSWMKYTFSNHLVLGTNELVGAISQDEILSSIIRELIKPTGERCFDIAASPYSNYTIEFSKDRFQKLLHEIELWKAKKLVTVWG